MNAPIGSDPHRTEAHQGETIDEGKGRIFPCESCGADLVFSIGQQSLQCPFCGSVKQIETQTSRPIEEQDLVETLEKLKKQKQADHAEKEQPSDEHAIRCGSCGAEVLFQGTLTSTNCPYCACPLQRDKVHDSVSRIPVDGILPFLVPQAKAAENLRAWVKSLWFAPNEFLRQGANGKFNGVYMPFFTYDSMTLTQFTGQRGDAYFVTVGEGKEQRTERRVNWTWVHGEFELFFDDVLVIAAQKQQLSLVQSLEPWPLERLVPYTPELLAGFFSRTYDVALDEGFKIARQRMESQLAGEVRMRIGGDEQQVTSQKTRYSQITFKHLLLPIWLLAYRYRNETYQVMINAATGEVCGQRPYSWAKISLTVLVAAVVGATIWYFTQR